MDDQRTAEPEIPEVGTDAVTGEPILANEARITAEDGTMWKPENYDAAKSEAAAKADSGKAELAP